MAGYTERQENRGLNSLALRIIGWLAMTWGAAQELLDIKSVNWATYMLWFSYTIFAFLLVEGVAQSSDRRLYFRRLLLFAVISEFLYDYYYGGKLWDPSRQNILVTLFVGFLVLVAAEAVRARFDNMVLTFLTLIALSYAGTVLLVKINAEMGLYGLLLLDFIYISYNVTYTRIMELIFFAVFLINVSADNYLNIMINDFYYSIPDKAFCLLGVILTWFYNGKRGPNSLVLKTAYYMYYPVMLLVLCLVKRAMM